MYVVSVNPKMFEVSDCPNLLTDLWKDNAILYYTILYYTILYYIILYYTILYYTILYYTILYYTILYYTILYYTIFRNGLLHWVFKAVQYTESFELLGSDSYIL